MTDNLDLTKYIKSKLDNNDTREKCLQDIGKSFDQYTNYHNLLENMDNNSISKLHEAILETQFFRKRFTKFVTCSREEANKSADDTRSIGYFTYGEFGGEYGYFKHRRKLDDIEKVWLTEHTECCYYNGQPCERWQDENGYAEEDCECELGKEYSSLILYELDEDLEKEMGVWKQEIIWYLDINYNKDEPETRFFSSSERYYSLTEIKKDAINNCEDEKVIQKIFKYNGNDTFKQGNIMIKCVRDDDSDSQ